MEYRREIDGLRAIAVLPVIFFHAGFETFSGGFVGVDVFFVISGYLITTIILAELEQEKFSIVKFYERRARRILPALFLVMLACIPFAWLWLMPGDMKNFSQSLAAISVFASNILFWRESGYFESAAELKPLLHTWSLALEEQFYVIFPLFLIIFWKFGKSWILAVLGLVFVSSLALAHWGAYVSPTSAFYLLPTRGWELLFGAFAAFYLSHANRKDFTRELSEVGGWLGVALILYAIFAYSNTTPFPGIYALVPTVGTILIILCATQQTSVGKFVGNKAFVSVGLISYSSYLWHQPLFAFVRHKSSSEPSYLVFISLSVLSLVLAYVSWRYVEAPFRIGKKFSRSIVFSLGLICSILFATVGFLGHQYDGFAEQRFSEKQLATIRSASASPLRKDCHFENRESSLTKDACRYFSANVRVAVIGNSHATELAYSMAEVLEEKELGIVQHTMSGCLHNYNIASEAGTVCGRWHKRVFQSILDDKSIEYVILSYRNEGYLNSKAYRRALVDLSSDLIESGKKVILVLQAPLLISHINQHLALALPNLSVSISSRLSSDWKRLYSPSVELLKELHPEVMVFDPAEVFCEGEFCYAAVNGLALYFDDNHMSIAGSRIIAEQLLSKKVRGVGF